MGQEGRITLLWRALLREIGEMLGYSRGSQLSARIYFLSYADFLSFLSISSFYSFLCMLFLIPSPSLVSSGRGAVLVTYYTLEISYSLPPSREEAFDPAHNITIINACKLTAR